MQQRPDLGGCFPGLGGWLDQLSEAMIPVRAWMVDKLALSPGETVLDLGAGFGDTGFDAAPVLGGDGRLITSDLSPRMVDTARHRARQRGVDNVEFRVIDAQRIPLADEKVDEVLCMNAYMVIPDVASALAETRRVFRPGRRLAMTVWGAPERNPWASVTSQILVDQGHIPPPDPEAPGITNLSDPAGTTTLLGNAGFSDVETADVDIHFSFDSIEDFDRWVADVAEASRRRSACCPQPSARRFGTRARRHFGPSAPTTAATRCPAPPCAQPQCDRRMELSTHDLAQLRPATSASTSTTFERDAGP